MSAESKRATDFDCCWATAASKSHLEPCSEEGSCSAVSVEETSETSAGMSRWRSPAAKTFDTATDAAAARAPGDTEVVVVRKTRTMGKPETVDDSVATVWVAIAHCISEALRRMGCCKDYFRLTVRPDRSPRLLSAARSPPPPAGSAESGPHATPAVIPEKNSIQTH